MSGIDPVKRALDERINNQPRKRVVDTEQLQYCSRQLENFLNDLSETCDVEYRHVGNKTGEFEIYEIVLDEFYVLRVFVHDNNTYEIRDMYIPDDDYDDNYLGKLGKFRTHEDMRPGPILMKRWNDTSLEFKYIQYLFEAISYAVVNKCPSKSQKVDEVLNRNYTPRKTTKNKIKWF